MLNKVIEIIKERYQKDDIVITNDTSLLDDLNLNSLEVADLICTFEDEFDIEIPDRVLGSFQTIHDIVEFIEKQ